MKSFVINSKTHGKFEVFVDDGDFERVSSKNWSINKKTENYYVAETRLSKKKCVRLHRFLLEIDDPKIEIDHKDRNPFNNCRDNLRIATRDQNSRNVYYGTNKTGFIGVYKSRNKYRACISVGDKTKHIKGSFNTPEEAARARDKVALEVSGEFAVLNFKPKEG